MKWSREQVDELVARRKAGETFKAIGTIMGFSRNAVAGQCWRLAIPSPKRQSARTSAFSRPILDIAFEDLRE